MGKREDILNLERNIKFIKAYLEKYPYKSIGFNNERGHYYVYLKDKHSDTTGNRNGKYVSVNSPLISTLVNVKYFTMLLPLLEKELNVLQTFQSDYKPNEKYEIINEIPERFRNQVEAIIKSPKDACKEWAAQPFIKNSFPFNDNQEFITRMGEHVRSKAEYIIANLLEEFNLPYKYEMEFRVGNKTTYPDFTIMHPKTCELYYLEYFGMMDSEEYLASALKKIATYQQTDCATHFIYIFESKSTPMSITGIKNLFMQTFFNEE